MKTAKFALLFSVVSGLCFAETWTGKLIDASCKAKSEAGATTDCTATRATTAFGIQLADGKVLALDADGNMKAAEAVKGAKSTTFNVSVKGSLDASGGVKVESLDIQE